MDKIEPAVQLENPENVDRKNRILEVGREGSIDGLNVKDTAHENHD